MIVRPKRVSGMNMSWNLNLFSGPKCTVGCGNCNVDFTVRMPLVDYPKVACPNCKVVNRIPFVYE